MATRKRLPPIYKIKKFANTYLGRVTKFQANALFLFGVLSHLLGRRCKPPLHPGRNEVKRTDHDLRFFHNIVKKVRGCIETTLLVRMSKMPFLIFSSIAQKNTGRHDYQRRTVCGRSQLQYSMEEYSSLSPTLTSGGDVL